MRGGSLPPFWGFAPARRGRGQEDWAASQSRTFCEQWAEAVVHEMDLVVEVSGEPVQEAAHHLGGEALGEDHEVHPAPGADRRHCVDGEPVSAPLHHGRLSLLAPGAAGDLVGANPDLVGEEDLVAILPRLRPERRPDFLMPAAHGLRGLLHSPLVPDAGRTVPTA